MQHKKYSSDLSTKSWQIIKKMLPVQRRSKWNLQSILNGILYVCKNGCVWRDLPSDFTTWQTVYWYYRKWVKEGVWENISRCLTVDYRTKSEKMPQPTLVIIDSQSVKNSSTSTEHVGIDGGKRIKGRKRFYLVDTLGNLIESFVCPANSYDGTTAIKTWKYAFDNPLLYEVESVFADATFGGTFKREMKQEMNIDVEIPKVPIAKKGKVKIHQKRWIVERTIAWINNNRRMAKEYERKIENANAFILIANIRRIANKI